MLLLISEEIIFLAEIRGEKFPEKENANSTDVTPELNYQLIALVMFANGTLFLFLQC